MSPLNKLLLIFTFGVVAVSAAKWSRIQGSMKHIATSLNYYWAVSADAPGYSYMCKRPCDGRNWVNKLLLFTQLDVSNDELCGVYSTGDVYTQDIDGILAGWRLIPGKRLKQVSCSGDGYIWGIDLEGQVFNCQKPCYGNDAWFKIDGTLAQLDGGQGFVYGVTRSGYIYSRPVDGSLGWKFINGTMTSITGSGENDLYGINLKGAVFRCSKPCKGRWQSLSDNNWALQCDATANVLVCVRPDNSIWVYS